MNDWSRGYDVSVGYTYGFCREMAPDWLDLCVRAAGGAQPRQGASGRPRFLELGCGQGMGLCLLAAANPGIDFVGIDFLPDHVDHARRIADAAGLANVRFVAADFVDLATGWPEDFGQFDYVAMHGVYSWVAPPVRAAVVECLRHAVRPGGFVYASYNAQPGWLGSMPFQHIARRLRDAGAKTGPEAIDESIALFDRLDAGGAGIFKILPALKPRLDSIRHRSRNYLVQEYLHDGWEPLWHSSVADDLARAGLAHAGTATLAEALLPGPLPAALRDTIAAQPDRGLQQDLQDVVINQAFRRDIFRRAPAGAPATTGTPPPMRVRLLAPPAPGSTLRFETAFGEVALQAPAYAEIVDALRAGPRPVEQLVALPGVARQGAANARQLLLLLLHAQVLAPEAAAPASAEAAQRLNVVIAREASKGLPYGNIAAAAIGSAIAITDVDLMLLDSWFAADRQADGPMLAEGVATRLAALDRKLHHAGKPLEGEAMRSQLLAEASDFLAHHIPAWRSLGVLL